MPLAERDVGHQLRERMQGGNGVRAGLMVVMVVMLMVVMLMVVMLMVVMLLVVMWRW